MAAPWTTLGRGVASFSLVPDGKYDDRVLLLLVTVQGQMARPAARDDKLSQVVLDRPADQGMVFEDAHGLGDEIDGLERYPCFSLKEKIHEPLEISERPSGIDQFRQDRDLGLRAVCPCARDRR